MSDFDFVRRIGDLSTGQRLHFYEVLAHQLTVVARMIWSDAALDDTAKVEQMKWLNEILHRVTAKVYTIRLKTHEWTDEDSLIAFGESVSHVPALGPRVGWAIRQSYASVT
ncbi:hypothetical protein J0H58_02345 [bacterium]|nr:hypothetical protein [bacterium]